MDSKPLANPEGTLKTDSEPVMDAIPDESPPFVTYACLGLAAAAFAADYLIKGTWAHEVLRHPWDGGWWTLWASCFFHVSVLHLAFNMYWLWALGSVLEGEIGSARYGLFLAGAAAVSSGFQLGFSDATTVGLAGIVYAVFGLMWVARHARPAFAAVLDSHTVGIMLVWLIGCIVATTAGLWNVGNAAHVSGLAFGVLIGLGTLTARPRPAGLAGAGLLALGALVVMFYAPWSGRWHWHQGLKAQARGEYPAAIAAYEASLKQGMEPQWVLDPLMAAQKDAGRASELPATWERLRTLESPHAQEQAREWAQDLASEAIQREDFASAVSWLERAKETSADKAWIYESLAMAYDQTGDAYARDQALQTLGTIDPQRAQDLAKTYKAVDVLRPKPMFAVPLPKKDVPKVEPKPEPRPEAPKSPDAEEAFPLPEGVQENPPEPPPAEDEQE